MLHACLLGELGEEIVLTPLLFLQRSTPPPMPLEGALEEVPGEDD